MGFAGAPSLVFAQAQFRLGEIYDRGKVVPKNYIEAAKWHRKAAEQGEVWAQVRLGFMYKLGEGVPQDYVRAYAWWNFAATQGKKAAFAAESRDELQSSMTAEQIARAQELSATIFNRINQSK